MNAAPERIWVCPLDVNSGLIDWSEGCWTPYCEGVEGEHEYVLASRLAEVEARLTFAKGVEIVIRAERDSLAREVERLREMGVAFAEPCEPGSFVGDIYYGDPINTTMGTHRWLGAEWEALPTVAHCLSELLAAEREKVERKDKALRETADELDAYYSVEYQGEHPYSVRKLAQAKAANPARAALNPEGETP